MKVYPALWSILLQMYLLTATKWASCCIEEALKLEVETIKSFCNQFNEVIIQVGSLSYRLCLVISRVSTCCWNFDLMAREEKLRDHRMAYYCPLWASTHHRTKKNNKSLISCTVLSLSGFFFRSVPQITKRYECVNYLPSVESDL